MRICAMALKHRLKLNRFKTKIHSCRGNIVKLTVKNIQSFTKLKQSCNDVCLFNSSSLKLLKIKTVLKTNASSTFSLSLIGFH